MTLTKEKVHELIQNGAEVEWVHGRINLLRILAIGGEKLENPDECEIPSSDVEGIIIWSLKFLNPAGVAIKDGSVVQRGVFRKPSQV